ncbi:hypothetical protein [Pseudomonas putida]
MNAWDDYLEVIGEDQFGSAVARFISLMGENHSVSEPLGDDEPPGQTSSYRFFASGVEVGFRNERLNHIHFFMQAHERYRPFYGGLLGLPAQRWSKTQIVDRLGEWRSSGGGKVSPLIGYVHPWIRYEFGSVALRFEFAGDESLWLVSLIGV